MDIRQRYLFSGRFGNTNNSTMLDYQVVVDTDDQAGKDIAEAKAKALFDANPAGFVLLTQEQIERREIPTGKSPSECFLFGGVHFSAAVFD
jgi:hypothetical protein